MPYVERDGSGNVVGVYQNRQPGYAEESLPADHADIAAFKNRASPKPEITARELVEVLKTKNLIAETDLPPGKRLG